MLISGTSCLKKKKKKNCTSLYIVISNITTFLFFSVPQLSSGADKQEASNTILRNSAASENPSLTVVGKSSASHLQKSPEVIDEDFSDQPSGIHTVIISGDYITLVYKAKCYSSII